MRTATTRGLFAFAWVAACLLACTHAGAAQPIMHKHRQAVGKVGPGEWNFAKSTEGHFSVSMPVQFNDFTVESSGDNEEVVRSFVVGGKSLDDVKFIAVRLVYRDGAVAAQRYFGQIGEGSSPVGEKKDLKRFKQDGHDAAQFSVADSHSWAMQRTVRAGDDLLLLMVEAPADSGEKMAPLAEKFFASLKIEADTPKDTKK